MPATRFHWRLCPETVRWGAFSGLSKLDALLAPNEPLGLPMRPKRARRRSALAKRLPARCSAPRERLQSVGRRRCPRRQRLSCLASATSTRSALLARLAAAISRRGGLRELETATARDGREP